jgi:hypothetical protein
MPIPQGSRTTVTERDYVCVVKFDDDLPNGPFAEGSAGNILQPGSFTVSVPTTGFTWSLVANLVSGHMQAEMNKACEGGKMKSYGGGNMVGHVGTVEPLNVLYKGGTASTDGPAKEGSCTVQVKITDVRTSAKQCCVLM